MSKNSFLIPAIVVAGLLVGAAQAQWLDTTTYLSLGDQPCALVYDSVSNKVFCTNFLSGDVCVIDGVKWGQPPFFSGSAPRKTAIAAARNAE